MTFISPGFGVSSPIRADFCDCACFDSEPEAGVPASFLEANGFVAQEERKSATSITINFFITDYNVIDFKKSNPH
jgi:hypothetical protein